MAASRFDRGCHLGEVMVEQEDDIVGEARFSQASGTAQVDEKDGDTTFLSEFPAAFGRRWN